VSDPAGALAAFGDWPGASIDPIQGGLINHTYRVASGGRRAVLQRVNPLFPPGIHHNIQAVTSHLEARGMLTPRLIPTTAGHLWAEVDGEVWRLLTFVDGLSFDQVGSPAQAAAAGALLGRFHRALDDLSHTFVHPRSSHDTPRHLVRLAEAVAAHPQHRLAAEVAPLAAGIAASRLPPLPPLAPRPCHGDPKFNNFLFAGAEAICLIDLDTVGPMALAHELGDAWRSWCNRNGEDQEVAALDLAVMAASLEGYRSERPLGRDEREAALLGVEWVSLELCARFAADALEERYFGWDPARFPGRGEHNLTRARGQWSLHQQLLGSRQDRAALLAG
jgi:Ser/Thr protein kinase RdoA (MazF antagonist)